LVLPEGVVDLSANRPPADVPLIASKASLVVRDDLHPALQYLLLHAALEAHAGPGIFQRAGEFPAPEVIDLPLSEEARHMYKSGPSILQRTLPFWLAELVQRLLIILLPVAGILYPLWSLLPKAYRWQMQRRIYRLYGELRLLENDLADCTDPDERARLLARIEDLDRRVLRLTTRAQRADADPRVRSELRGASGDRRGRHRRTNCGSSPAAQRAALEARRIESEPARSDADGTPDGAARYLDVERTAVAILR
jgi:hypothetical protein